MIEDRESQSRKKVQGGYAIKVHKMGHMSLPDEFSFAGHKWSRGGKGIIKDQIPMSVWVAKCSCGFFLTGERVEYEDDDCEYFRVDTRTHNHMKDCSHKRVVDAREDLRGLIWRDQ